MAEDRKQFEDEYDISGFRTTRQKNRGEEETGSAPREPEKDAAGRPSGRFGRKKPAAGRRAKSGSRADRLRRLRRGVTILGVVAAVLIVILIVSLVRKNGSKSRARKAGTSWETDTQSMVSVPGDEVLHLSFPQLRLESDASRAVPNEMTVTAFNELLEDLYKRGYVLVDIRLLSEKDDSGTYHVSEVKVPRGKKPLVISQYALHYTQESGQKGYASGIELSDDGRLTNLYADANGGTRTASCDVVTCVDDFIGEHPDFSVRDARGVIALTDDTSVLGYADAASAECQDVIDKLYEEGWLFAGSSCTGISFGAEMRMFQADVTRWQEIYLDAVGLTEILILPDGADIGNRSPYTSDNGKYSMLSELGFRYYCIDDTHNMTWMQTGDGFVRQSIHQVNSYEQYLALMDNSLDAFFRTRRSEISAAESASAGQDAEAQSEEAQTGDEEQAADDTAQQDQSSDGSESDDNDSRGYYDWDNKYEEAGDEYDENGELQVDHEDAI